MLSNFGCLWDSFALSGKMSPQRSTQILLNCELQAMDGLKVGEDALQKLGCALEANPIAGSVPPAPQHSSPYSAPSNCEGGALQGASTPGAQPGSRVQSSSSSITEDNSELVDTGTVASSSRLLQADENGPVLQRPAATDSAAGPHDPAMQDLNGHAMSTQPSASKDCTFPVELMTSCVATLFMLQVIHFLTPKVPRILSFKMSKLMDRVVKNINQICPNQLFSKEHCICWPEAKEKWTEESPYITYSKLLRIQNTQFGPLGL